MAAFFFITGLELKRELLVGELASLKQALLPILAAIGGMLVPAAVMYFSRKREFIADTGGADLAGHQNMINALKRLGQVEPEALPEQMAAFGINDKGGIMALFSSHPPIEARIAALEERAQRHS